MRRQLSSIKLIFSWLSIFFINLAESKVLLDTFASPSKSSCLAKLTVRGGAEVARWAHNPKVTGSSPVPATNRSPEFSGDFHFSAMHFIYCLYSPQFDKTYVGRTSNLQGRLDSHNHPSNKGHTRRFQPWEILFFEQFQTLEEASKRERFYKSGVGRELIRQKITTS